MCVGAVMWCGGSDMELGLMKGKGISEKAHNKSV